MIYAHVINQFWFLKKQKTSVVVRAYAHMINAQCTHDQSVPSSEGGKQAVLDPACTHTRPKYCSALTSSRDQFD